MVEVECDNCGEITEKRPCRIERSENDFCSPECNSEYQKSVTGEDHHRYKERETYTCLNCGSENETTPKRAEKKVYCDKECMAEHFEERMSGENNPSWDGGLEEVACEWCGNVNEYVPARAEHRRFCSNRCYKDWLSNYRENNAWMGEENPMWKGGQDRDRNPGPNWDEQRQKTLNRDNHSCILCGSVGRLHVHHKRPLRTFDRDVTGWWNNANSLDNLVTLCQSCHSHVHANPTEYLGGLLG